MDARMRSDNRMIMDVPVGLLSAVLSSQRFFPPNTGLGSFVGVRVVSMPKPMFTILESLGWAASRQEPRSEPNERS
jgi:hypothetical protein